MADRSVRVILRAEIADYKRKLGEAGDAAKKAAEDTGRIAKTAGQGFDDLTLKVGVVGAALTGLSALAVRSFVGFDKAMSAVAATGEDAKASINDLREAALEAGKRTVFSATESANAIEELAKAGVSARDILGGGLDGALNLAAAGSLDVADAAGIAATAMTQFGLRGTQVNHVADLLAAGAGKAMGDVSDLGLALKQAGLVANQTGLSIEETTGGLASFASAGLLGSDAGTSFKTMLQRLTPQSQEAQKAMDALGISAYDANGQFIGLANFAGVLQGAMKNLTPEARNAAMSVIFGSDAVRAATQLYNEGADGIQAWIDKVNDQGYAADTAATKLDNLAGDWEQLTGAIETAMIGAGEGANGPLRSLVQGVTNLVSAFSGLPPWIQQVSLLLVGGSGLALLGVAALAKLSRSAFEVRDALVATGMASEATAAKITTGFGKAAKVAGKVAGAIALIGVAMASVPDDIDQGTNEILANLTKIADGADVASTAFEGINDSFVRGNAFEDFQEFVNQASRTDVWAKIDDGIAHFLDGVAGIVGLDSRSSFQKQVDALKKYGTELGNLATSDLPKASRAFQSMYEQAGGGDAGAKLLKLMPDLRDALIGIADSANLSTDDATLLKIALGELIPTTDAATASTQNAAAGLDTFSDSQDEATKALEEWRQTVADADAAFVDLQGAYDAVIEKNKAYAESTADATKSSKDSWQDYYDGVSVSADDYIAQLQAQVDAQARWEQNILDISARVRDGMSGDMRTAGEQMIDELLKLGPEGAAQVQLLHDMTDTQFRTVVSLWSQRGTDAVTAFTRQVESARPPQIPTPIVSTQADAMSQFLARQQAILDRNPLVVHTTTAVGVGPGAMLARAGGGPVFGPGTSTSDSIPVRMSNDEHVWSAAEVRGAGGHGAVASLRAAARRGALRGFAAGGSPGYSPGYAPGGGGAAAGRLAGGPLVAVQIENVTAANPNAAVDRLVTRLGDKLAAYGLTGEGVP